MNTVSNTTYIHSSNARSDTRVPSLLLQPYMQQNISAPPWQHHLPSNCKLCGELILTSPRKHRQRCWQAQRCLAWQNIVKIDSPEPNPQQIFYISARNLMRDLLHNLNCVLADGDQALLEAGLTFINKWRFKERKHRNIDYAYIIRSISTCGNVFLQVTAEHMLLVLDYHGTSLPVILGIEDTYWALSRKLDFTTEENSWLLQWVHCDPVEVRENINLIKAMFLLKFLPSGRPRKSRRILAKKLAELRKCCKEYEYSSAPWTQEGDANLIRIARRYESDEERVYAFVVHCYIHEWRLKSSAAILKRIKILECKGVDLMEEEDQTWVVVRGKPRALDVFQSRRRASV